MSNYLLSRPEIIDALNEAKSNLEKKITNNVSSSEIDICDALKVELTDVMRGALDETERVITLWYNEWLKRYNKSKGFAQWLKYPCLGKPSDATLAKWFWEEISELESARESLCTAIVKSASVKHLSDNIDLLGSVDLSEVILKIPHADNPLFSALREPHGEDEAIYLHYITGFQPVCDSGQATYDMNTYARNHANTMVKLAEKYTSDMSVIVDIWKVVHNMSYLDYFTISGETATVLRRNGVDMGQSNCHDIAIPREKIWRN